MKGYIIKEDGTHHAIDFEDELHVLQKLIGGLIDITRRPIGDDGKEYLIVCDDEGLMKGCNITATQGYEPALVGTLLVVNKGDSEDFASLSDEDITYISNSTRNVMFENKEDGTIHIRSTLRITENASEGQE